MKPVSAWPTAADWLSGRRPPPGSTPTAAEYLASRRQGPRSTSTEPQGASAGGDATSAYRRLFRAKMEECKAEARMKGENWTMRAVMGKSTRRWAITTGARTARSSARGMHPERVGLRLHPGPPEQGGPDARARG